MNEKEMEPLLSLSDVTNLLHVHLNTVRRWSDLGLIKSIQINHRGDRRFRKQDISLFLAKMNTNTTQDDVAELPAFES